MPRRRVCERSVIRVVVWPSSSLMLFRSVFSIRGRVAKAVRLEKRLVG
jgi:hypothetical protein